ncbi:MAG: PspC domain-containing protein [Bacteroidales bacterium]|nr:PspC domain-containing protein [Bacteroidales bacterium]
MKTIVSINIRGTVFQVEEDAYLKLKNYLDSIELHFKNRPAGDEIISDIEWRIVELFQQQMAGDRKVITMSEVENMIAIMGHPADFDDQNKEPLEHRVIYHARRKRLFRDMDHRIIGGVCSGLSAYFDVDPTWFRLAFVVATLSGLSPILYVVLWIVIPAARTIADKLEMYGAPVNISNIEKAIRDEMGDLREKFGEYTSKAKAKFTRW